MSNHRLFESTRLGRLPLGNRLAVAPMTRVSAGADGLVTDQMIEYYRGFAEGGFGLVITEGLYTDRVYSQGYQGQPGLTCQAQGESWKPLNQALHAAGARSIAQLMHAGALSQFNAFSSDTAGPSAIQPRGQQMSFYDGVGSYALPRAMTVSDIDTAIRGFADAALLAQAAGFDGVEIHGANGYLLDQFLSVSTNARTDAYGGRPENRVRLICEVIQAVRHVTAKDFVVGVRISQTKVNDDQHRWPEAEAAAATIFSTIAQAGADYIHTTEPDAAAPAFEGSDSLASLAARFGGVPVIANGGVEAGDQALRLVQEQGAALVALGKAALANPDWARRVCEGSELRGFDFALLAPRADLENAQRYFTERSAGGQVESTL
ncbi:oxidoreductase [Marinobacterium rhizophilum]|uniref:NADH:flavin oxidoreductase n=1 Tax=Marinobacterium rhizophilum TaxID=420402 RepID=A0ABY5HH98_9GAMM|nr:NADH:flavin oxidoreductase [Marinobacterium rhizophilum]UTW11731.1 NADH:flavin oxidoreductase [Marinobacterium rhizophilum]